MGKIHCYLLLFIFSLNSLSGQNASQESVSTGAEKGTLFIAGGGIKSDSLFMAFIQLAGGVDAPIVVIPTALNQC